jgi:hypothetical protein
MTTKDLAHRLRAAHWDNPLGIAVRHDKARARAHQLRQQANELDAKADELATRYQAAESDMTTRFVTRG